MHIIGHPTFGLPVRTADDFSGEFNNPEVAAAYAQAYNAINVLAVTAVARDEVSEAIGAVYALAVAVDDKCAPGESVHHPGCCSE